MVVASVLNRYRGEGEGQGVGRGGEVTPPRSFSTNIEMLLHPEPRVGTGHGVDVDR